LRLISWNLHALPFIGRNVEQRMRRAAGALIEHAPDVVLLQEIWTANALRVFERALGDSYAVLIGENGHGRHCGGLLTLINKTTWSVEGRARFTPFDAQAPAWRFWEGDGLMKKGALVAIAKHVETSREARFVNTHLQSQYGYFHTADGALRARLAYLPERIAQLRQLELLAQDDGRLVMIGGDFNTEPHEWPALQLPSSWQDLSAPLRLSGERATYIEKTGPTAWYDYVFASRPVEAEALLIRNSAVGYPYSDHHGLVIDVRRRAGSSSPVL
jgi:endonuclease/exonuclease/phosphatase family metal-dependent hydrolase